RYDSALNWVLDRQGATLLVAVGTVVLTALLYVVMPKGLFPTQDTGQLQARVEATRDISFAKMSQLQRQVAAEILKDPAVESLSSLVGVDASANSMLNTGQMLINLKASHGS